MESQKEDTKPTETDETEQPVPDPKGEGKTADEAYDAKEEPAKEEEEEPPVVRIHRRGP